MTLRRLSSKMNRQLAHLTHSQQNSNDTFQHPYAGCKTSQDLKYINLPIWDKTLQLQLSIIYLDIEFYRTLSFTSHLHKILDCVRKRAQFIYNT